MEPEAVKVIADLLSSGGNAAIILIVYIAFQALSSAREVARDIKALKESATASQPVIQEIAKDMRESAAQMQAMDGRMARQEIQLAAALAVRSQPQQRS